MLRWSKQISVGKDFPFYGIIDFRPATLSVVSPIKNEIRNIQKKILVDKAARQYHEMKMGKIGNSDACGPCCLVKLSGGYKKDERMFNRVEQKFLATVVSFLSDYYLKHGWLNFNSTDLQHGRNIVLGPTH